MANKYIDEGVRDALIEASSVFGKETVTELVKKLVSLNKVARGRLINSLNYKLRGALTGIAIEFEAEDYIQYVNDGRKPGKFAPVNAIKDWCKAKGIDPKFSYPINLKIKRVGIAPTKFIDEVLNDKKLDEYSKKIEDISGKKIEQLVETIFEQSQFKKNNV